MIGMTITAAASMCMLETSMVIMTITKAFETKQTFKGK
jgi:hypothetical protein